MEHVGPRADDREVPEGGSPGELVGAKVLRVEHARRLAHTSGHEVMERSPADPLGDQREHDVAVDHRFRSYGFRTPRSSVQKSLPLIPSSEKAKGCGRPCLAAAAFAALRWWTLAFVKQCDLDRVPFNQLGQGRPCCARPCGSLATSRPCSTPRHPMDPHRETSPNRGQPREVFGPSWLGRPLAQDAEDHVISGARSCMRSSSW